MPKAFNEEINQSNFGFVKIIAVNANVIRNIKYIITTETNFGLSGIEFIEQNNQLKIKLVEIFLSPKQKRARRI